MKIKESQLRNMIAKAIDEVVNERAYDYAGSGIEDYQGTGSEESKERVEKIRQKQGNYSPTGYESKIFSPGKSDPKNMSTFSQARKLYGGRNSKDTFEVFKEFVKPLSDKVDALRKSGDMEAYKRLDDLLTRFFTAYSEWAKEYKGAAEE